MMTPQFVPAGTMKVLVFALLAPMPALAFDDDPLEAPTANVEDALEVDPKAAAELQFPDGRPYTEHVDETSAADTQASNTQASNTQASKREVPTAHGRRSAGPGVLDVRGRRFASLAVYHAKVGETLRTVAYRYCTSPVTVALANALPFDPARDNPLTAGQKVQVPVAFRSPSGLHEAEQLTSGPGVRSERHDRNWGRPHVVALLRQVFRDLAQRWPQRHPAVVGALSRPNGGKLGRHKSHRSGQDIDIGYLTKTANREEWGRPRLDEIDYERMWHFLDALERTGQVAAVYMAPGIQRRTVQYALTQGVPLERLQVMFQYAPRGGSASARRGDSLIRYSPGHRDHFHVRFSCPEDFRAPDRDS
jgi:hypothetical protein